MKTIGLIGGMSWESTATYYRLLNEMARERLGALHSAELLLWSFDFAEVEACQACGDWDLATEKMVEAARRVELGGAECIVICSNTMHKMAGVVQAAVDIPLIHVADVTARAVEAAGVSRPCLLATRFTVEQEFYTARLKETNGVEAVLPDAAGGETLQKIIYDELCQGKLLETSKKTCLDVARRCLAPEQGADSVILGCTELGLLIGPQDFEVPCFDTTELHARAAIEFALA